MTPDPASDVPAGEFVSIHYLRPPDRETVFVQRLLAEEDGALVTLARDLAFDPPLTIQDRIALEVGSVAIWFTFPGRWYDVGLFHRADGTLSGTYFNVLRPPVLESVIRWRTTDLFLDLWIPAGGAPALLDREELEEAVSKGIVNEATARRALEEGERLLQGAREGLQPPPVVRRWDLSRALDVESRLLREGAPAHPPRD